MDSTGLGMLARLRKHQAAHDGQTILRGASPMICKPLEITGMHKVFTPASPSKPSSQIRRATRTWRLADP